jgi:hypothetical protein
MKNSKIGDTVYVSTDFGRWVQKCTIVSKPMIEFENIVYAAKLDDGFMIIIREKDIQDDEYGKAVHRYYRHVERVEKLQKALQERKRELKL